MGLPSEARQDRRTFLLVLHEVVPGEIQGEGIHFDLARSALGHGQGRVRRLHQGLDGADRVHQRERLSRCEASMGRLGKARARVQRLLEDTVGEAGGPILGEALLHFAEG
jgi:hypothetical protein